MAVIENDETFLQKTRITLEAGSDQLPDDVRRDLQAARYQALDNAQTKSVFDWRWVTGLGAGIAASVVLIMVMIIHPAQQPSVTPMTEQATLTADEALALSDDVDLDEDVEFYQWLADEDEVSG